MPIELFSRLTRRIRFHLGSYLAFMKSLFASLSFLAVLVLCGCATMDSSQAPGADLTKLHTFYVAKLPADGRGIERLIADRLDLMGFKATSGSAEAPGSPVDAVVTYQDRWMWDITMYMIQLDIQIRDGKTNFVLASGHVMRPSLQRKSPSGMVEEALTGIFKK